VLSFRWWVGHDVVVSNEFRPGHPILFWMAIVVLTFGFYSGAKAAITFDDCQQVSSGKKTWVVFPPEWQCGDHGRVRFTEPQ
jgi:hypothetical protein